MAIRDVTLYLFFILPHMAPWGLTFLLLMETELLLPAVTWSVASETTGPLLPTFVLYNHSRSAYLNTCPLMKANRTGNSQIKRRQTKTSSYPFGSCIEVEPRSNDTVEQSLLEFYIGWLHIVMHAVHIYMHCCVLYWPMALYARSYCPYIL